MQVAFSVCLIPHLPHILKQLDIILSGRYYIMIGYCKTYGVVSMRQCHPWSGRGLCDPVKPTIISGHSHGIGHPPTIQNISYREYSFRNIMNSSNVRYICNPVEYNFIYSAGITQSWLHLMDAQVLYNHDLKFPENSHTYDRCDKINFEYINIIFIY